MIANAGFAVLYEDKRTSKQKTGFYILFFLIKSDIPEIDQQIQTYKYKIQNIHDQYKGIIPGENFCGNAGKISGHDEQDEKRAHPFRRAGTIVVDHTDRPRKAKAYKHNGFKNCRHKYSPSIKLQAQP